jgi:transposase InsO family protein
MSKSNSPASNEALLRFSVVSQIYGRIGSGESRAQAIAAIAAREHGLPGTKPVRVSARTLHRWFAAWEHNGLTGLDRQRRPQALASTVLPQRFLDFLATEKRNDYEASIPELIKRGQSLGHLDPNDKIARSSVWRAARRLGLSLSRRKGAKSRDSRRFAYPHRMEMVLCDGKHFRAGIDRKKRVALFFIDDCTRFVLHVVVGTSESAELFLRGLFECICRFGRMTTIYVDNGPGFIALDTYDIVGRLEMKLINGEAGYPEGHGKVERFNRTVLAAVLRGLDRNSTVDPSCEALQLRLMHYIEAIYAHCPHESLDGDTPWHRFQADPRPLDRRDEKDQLRAHFGVWVERRVTNDHTVSVDSVDYETPRGYAGLTIKLRRGVLDGTLGMLHEGKLITLAPVDLAGNARARRASNVGPSPDQAMGRTTPLTTAADLEFRREFGPIVDSDGGFPQDLESNNDE